MNDYEKITEFNIKLNRETVFHLIDCYQDSPIYDEVIDEYNKLENEAYQLIKPAAFIKFGSLPDKLATNALNGGAPVIFVLLTIGNEIAERGTTYFDKGDYLSEMLINSMADTYLFQLDDIIQKIVQDECSARHLGIALRLDAPENIPMSAQKIILDEIKASEDLQMDVTEGFMFTTVKTTGYILVLTDEENTYHAHQNCRICKAVNCKMRKISDIQVTLIGRGDPLRLECSEKETLLEAMIRQGVYISAACGGKGTCGKCRIQILEGNLDIIPSDRVNFSERELADGYRLSCKAYPKADCTIKLAVGDETDFDVVTDYQQASLRQEDFREEGYIIGIDIGTTTIAMNLIGTTSKNIIQSFTTINKQRAYGADVISRMQASNDGKKEILRESIRKDLLEGIRNVVEVAGISKKLIQKIAIAGNTTMGHLLLGYSCQTLGSYPFTPVNIGTIELPLKEVLGVDYLNAPTVLLPGISTYVGGDIVAGLLTCNFDKAEKPCLLIDLGTNGEIAIGNKDKILVSSTAAGPAFEGGNISCGIGSIAGAICSIDIEGNKINCQTISQKAPVGICGTGVIEFTSELVKSGLVDETGLLVEQYFKEGYEITKDEAGNAIKFTQKDIREVQLAKSAVRAGVETLILRYGITYDEIDTVYLAGGFGYRINMEKAIHIGLLPKELSGKIKAIGNSSLGGAVKYLLDEHASAKVDQIIKVSNEINLSKDKEFNSFYIEHMFFWE